MLTRVVSPDEIHTHAAEIAVCPVLFQEYIPKQPEVRVIVIGTRCFAFAIHSQAHELSAEDVRGVAPEWLRREVVRLPRDVAIALRRFVRHQGLVFAAVDFAVDEQGRYVFLENNANGQWLWLERLTGFPLSAEMLAYLLRWAGSLRQRSRPPVRKRARSAMGLACQGQNQDGGPKVLLSSSRPGSS